MRFSRPALVACVATLPALSFASTPELAGPAGGAPVPPTLPGGSGSDARTLELASNALELAADASLRPTDRLQGRTPPAGQRPWARFASERGPGWTAVWREATAVPSRVYGSFIPAPGAVRSAPAAAEAAAAVLAAHLDLFAPGAAWTDFRLVTNHLSVDGTYRTVGWTQSHGGLDVLGGQLSVRIKNDRIFMIASEAWPNVSSARPSPQTVPASVAQTRARSWVASDRGGQWTVEGVDEPVILPLAYANGALDYRTVVRVRLSGGARFENWDVYVDAATGAPVARRQTLMFADGTLQLNTVNRWPGNGRLVVPARQLTVDAANANGSQAVTTAADGSFTIPGPGATSVTNALQPDLDPDPNDELRSGISGPDVRVLDGARSRTNFSVTVPAGGSGVIADVNDQFDDATINTYAALHVARDRLLELVPGLEWLTDEQQLIVTNANGTCNALFSPGQSIIFMFRAGGPCENTGRIDDVVFHEFGHKVHAESLLPGVGAFTSNHSEGLSDYLAASITGDSGMARGFFFSNSPLRELNPAGNIPFSSVEGQGQHAEGTSYGGAMWDTRSALVERLGPQAGVDQADRLWFETTRRASGLFNTFQETVAADDDDGDLGNGSPNFCEIYLAFRDHELVVDDTLVLEVGETRLQDDFTVVQSVQQGSIACDLPELQVTGAELEWFVTRGDETDVPSGTVSMADTEGGFEAAIPTESLLVGDLVSYRVRVRLGDGTSINQPANPADPFYQELYGDVDELFCTDFEENPGRQGFSTELLVGNPENAGANDWQWGTPAGFSTDPGAPFSGAAVFGNDLGLIVGGSRFNGQYQNNVVNQANAPAVDVSGYERMFLRYRRWLSVEDGLFDQASVISNGQLVWENAVGDGSRHHIDEEWREAYVDLSGTADDQGEVQVSFQLATDGGLTFGGWTLDDLCVVGLVEPECGNGEVELGEQCDDGNLTDFDGCDASCTPTQPPECGNGRVEAMEICDDGNRVDGDGCQADCTETPVPECGNGRLEGDEVCDDGNLADGDGCEATCQLTPAPDVPGDDPEPEPQPDDPGPSLGGGLGASEGGCTTAAGERSAVGTVFVGAGLAYWVARRRRRRA
jgi:cysteine-rich repeat protein